MKRFLLMFLLQVGSLSLFAQNLNNEYSESFPLFVNAWEKVTLLSNGNTALLTVSDDNGIYVSMFGHDHKKIATHKLVLQYLNEKFEKTEVLGVYEINTQLVAFLSKSVKGTPTLFRLDIEINKGTLLHEEIVLELPDRTTGMGFAYAVGGVSEPGFLVIKDPASDYYAVLGFNSLAEKPSERIRVFHFSPLHKILNESFFPSPDNSYKYINYIDMYVKGGDYVLIGTYVFNSKMSLNKKSKVYLAKLEINKPGFENVELPYSDLFKQSSGKFEFNKKTGNVNLLLIVEKEKEYGGTTSYIILLQPFNPGNMQLSVPIGMPFQKSVQAYQKARPKKGLNSIGMPHHFFIDENGNNIVIFQSTAMGGGSSMSSNKAQIHGGYTRLGDVFLSNFTDMGMDNYGAFLPCNYDIEGKHRYLTYTKAKKGEKPAQYINVYGRPKFWFFHIDLIATSEYTYLFMNTNETNLNRPVIKKATMTRQDNSLVSVGYRMNKTGEVDKIPVTTVAGKFNNFSSSAFDPLTKKYATLEITYQYNPETLGASYDGRIVWSTLE